MTPPEYAALNEPDDRPYNQIAETTLNFLNREVLGEAYDQFPQDPAPLLYGAYEGGELVAAASMEPTQLNPQRYIVELLGVREDMRGQGIGSEFLEHVEQAAANLGAHELAVDPTWSPDNPTRVTDFYTRRGYTAEFDELGRLDVLVKGLTHPEIPPLDEIQ